MTTKASGPIYWTMVSIDTIGVRRRCSLLAFLSHRRPIRWSQCIPESSALQDHRLIDSRRDRFTCSRVTNLARFSIGRILLHCLHVKKWVRSFLRRSITRDRQVAAAPTQFVCRRSRLMERLWLYLRADHTR